jgi:hypothetical protein
MQVFINGVAFHNSEGLQPIVNVSKVEIHNDGNHIGSYAEVIVPQVARIAYTSNTSESQTNDNPNPNVTYDAKNDNYIIQNTRMYFNTGDNIVIKAKYAGFERYGDATGYVVIFNGFLYDFYETIPLKIKCLDYIYWFNIGIYGQKITQNLANLPYPTSGASNQGVTFKSIDFKDLLNDLLKYVNITIGNWNVENGTSFDYVTLDESIFDMPLVNISFSLMSPAAVLEWFKKEIGLNITLLGTILYVNIASNTQNVVYLQTDTNVINSSLQTTNLQKKNLKFSSRKGSNSVFLRLKLKCYFIKTNGTRDSFEIGDPNGQMREAFFYNVAPGPLTTYLNQSVPSNYLTIAQNTLDKYKQDRYSGEVELFLYPIISLFDKINYKDLRFQERDADYVCTLLTQTFDDSGYHKKAKLTYLDNPTL